MREVSSVQTYMSFGFSDTAAKGLVSKTSGDFLLSALLFLGLGGTLYSMAAPDAYPQVIIPAGLFVIALLNVIYALPKYRRMLYIFLAVWVAILLAFTLGETANGMRVVASGISDVLGARYGRIFPQYEALVAPESRALCATYFLLYLSIGIAALCLYLVKRGNLIAALLALLAISVSEIATGIQADFIWTVLLFCAIALLLYRGGAMARGIALSGSGKALLSGIALVFLSAVLCFAVFELASPEGYQKSGALAAFETRVKDGIDGLRYDKTSPGNLPEGDFSSLGDLNLRAEVPALQVNMSRPQSLYLRGYVGASYDADGWDAVDNARLYESAGLFYRLHEDGFYGQTELAKIAYLLDDGTTDMDPIGINVTNINASSKYVYAPYEISEAGSSLLAADGIGDAALRSGGFYGKRMYSYVSYPNQVKRYTELVSVMHEVQDAGYAELEEYLLEEGNYNAFVYDDYTALPEETAELLHSRLGDYDTEGAAHYSYQKSKQSILEYLSDNASYSETPKARGEGEDFLASFLRSGEGYSVHYATAATLMFRYYGIAARYVEGFLLTPKEVEAHPDGNFTLTGASMHAWTEFYQDGIGWIPFEVTPPYLNVMEQADMYRGYDTNDGKDVQESSSIDADVELDKIENEKVDGARGVMDMLQTLLLALAAMALAVAAAYVTRKRLALKKRKLSFETADRSRAIINLFLYSRDLLLAAGVDIGKGSAYEAAAGAGALCGEGGEEHYLRAVANHHRALFSTHTMEEDRRAENVYLNVRLTGYIKRDIKLPKRLLLWAKGLY